MIAGSQHRRVTKYRRLKNLLKKCLEISVQCDLKLNVQVYTTKQHKIQEYYSHDDFSLNHIQEMKVGQPRTIGERVKHLDYQSIYIGECIQN